MPTKSKDMLNMMQQERQENSDLETPFHLKNNLTKTIELKRELHNFKT
jgi:hypothetical protein